MKKIILRSWLFSFRDLIIAGALPLVLAALCFFILPPNHVYAQEGQSCSSDANCWDANYRCFGFCNNQLGYTCDMTACYMGVCGTANGKTYPYSTSSYGADYQCAQGAGSTNTAFPAQGSTVTWTCTGITSGGWTGPSSPTCSASRTVAPVTGVCGSANGTSATSAPVSNLCTTTYGNSAVTGSGPWTWTCNGGNGGGSSGTCQVNRAACTALTYRAGTSGFSTGTGGPTGSSISIAPGQTFYTYVDYGQQTDAIQAPNVGGSYTCTWQTWSGTVARFVCTASNTPNGYSYRTGTNNYFSGTNICASGPQTIGTVTVASAVTVSLLANPNYSVNYNSTVQLSWNVQNATACTSPDMPAGSGSNDWSRPALNPTGSVTSGNITTDVTYHLNCTGPGNPGSGSAVVDVGPSVDLKINGSDGPVNVNRGSSANITWNNIYAVSCSGSGAWSGSKTPASGGSQSTGALTTPGTTTYTLMCLDSDSPSGNASDSVTVTVNTCNNLSFVSGNVSPSSVLPNGSYTVSCDYGAASNSINPTVGSGSCVFTGWSGTAAQFSCTAGSTLGTFSNSCTTTTISPDYYCPNTNSIANLKVTPAAPSNVTEDNSTCGQIKISWGAVSGATSYNLYRNTIGTTPTIGTTAPFQTGITSLTYSDPVTVGVYYYWVTAVGNTAESQPTAPTPPPGTSNPVSPISCSASLSLGKDIIKLNTTTLSPAPRASCGLPTDMSFLNNSTYNPKVGDNVTFRVNVCNSSGSDGNGVQLYETMTNLTKPTGSQAFGPTNPFNAYFLDSNGVSNPLSFQASCASLYSGQYCENSNSNSTTTLLQFNLSNYTITAGTQPSLTLTGELVDPGTGDSTARFSNDAQGSYSSGSFTDFHTPLIFYLLNGNYPSVKDIP